MLRHPVEWRGSQPAWNPSTLTHISTVLPSIEKWADIFVAFTADARLGTTFPKKAKRALPTTVSDRSQTAETLDFPDGCAFHRANMRLLNTRTSEFKEINSHHGLKYAILSHRWSEQEVSYEEMQKGTALEGLGLSKIRHFCRLAADKGFDWAWVDTCCIDKRSSAELTESMNSMWKWYRASEVCYVYLADVHHSKDNLPESLAQFRQSDWFSRGWTLQELLAPQEILFFDADWNEMGSLSDYATDVSEITRIACHYLFSNYERALYPKPKREIQFASVAERMSWASYRVTSKEEDIAYCLLGLFGVNVSLLYGEGAGMAFRRLQIEIMNDRRTNQSLLGFRMKKDPACLHPIHAVSEDLETFSVISNSRIQSEGCIQ